MFFSKGAHPGHVQNVWTLVIRGSRSLNFGLCYSCNVVLGLIQMSQYVFGQWVSFWLFWLCSSLNWTWNETIIRRLKCRLSSLVWGHLLFDHQIRRICNQIPNVTILFRVIKLCPNSFGSLKLSGCRVAVITTWLTWYMWKHLQIQDESLHWKAIVIIHFHIQCTLIQRK